MVSLPKDNLVIAQEANRILGEARDAAASSAQEAAEVAAAASIQLQSLKELMHGGTELERLAQKLTNAARFLKSA
jgi:hypothetical protein